MKRNFIKHPILCSICTQYNVQVNAVSKRRDYDRVDNVYRVTADSPEAAVELVRNTFFDKGYYVSNCYVLNKIDYKDSVVVSPLRVNVGDIIRDESDSELYLVDSISSGKNGTIVFHCTDGSTLTYEKSEKLVLMEEK